MGFHQTATTILLDDSLVPAYLWGKEENGVSNKLSE